MASCSSGPGVCAARQGRKRQPVTKTAARRTFMGPKTRTNYTPAAAAARGQVADENPPERRNLLISQGQVLAGGRCICHLPCPGAVFQNSNRALKASTRAGRVLLRTPALARLVTLPLASHWIPVLTLLNSGWLKTLYAWAAILNPARSLIGMNFCMVTSTFQIHGRLMTPEPPCRSPSTGVVMVVP